MTKGGSKPGAAKPCASATSSRDKKTTRGRSEATGPGLETDVSQKCLDIFCDALKPSQEDSRTLQEVKGHLYRRDFATAFGQVDYLRVYASRWSPSRALAYAQIFDELPAGVVARSKSGCLATGSKTDLNVVCFGGGAGAELIALAAVLNTHRDDVPSAMDPGTHVALIDIANWGEIVKKLYTGIVNPPRLSPCASQAKKDTNKALLNTEVLSMSFKQMDVLLDEADSLRRSVQDAGLVTFMFTLNELYSTSLPKTQRLLSNTLRSMPIGSHLLVVDSPGSYSTVALNGAEKKYPMQWLLKYTMLERSGEVIKGAPAAWTQILSEDSRWFRLPTGLRYPIELEDMRYQIHLFRREASDVGVAA